MYDGNGVTRNAPPLYESPKPLVEANGAGEVSLPSHLKGKKKRKAKRLPSPPLLEPGQEDPDIDDWLEFGETADKLLVYNEEEDTKNCS